MVLTPANAHLPIAEAAFDAGRHVLCEKPLEVTVARGETLVAAGRTAKRRLGICLQHPLRGQPAAACRACSGGAWRGAGGDADGAVVALNRPRRAGCGALARDGGGVLMTKASNSPAFISFLLGVEIFSVWRRAAQVRTTALHRMETEDYAGALVRLRNGAPGTIVATVAAYPGSPEFMHIIGSKGRRDWMAAT